MWPRDEVRDATRGLERSNDPLSDRISPAHSTEPSVRDARSGSLLSKKESSFLLSSSEKPARKNPGEAIISNAEVVEILGPLIEHCRRSGKTSTLDAKGMAWMATVPADRLAKRSSEVHCADRNINSTRSPLGLLVSEAMSPESTLWVSPVEAPPPVIEPLSSVEDITACAEMEADTSEQGSVDSDELWAQLSTEQQDRINARCESKRYRPFAAQGYKYQLVCNELGIEHPEQDRVA